MDTFATFCYVIWGIAALVIGIRFLQSVRIVPTQKAYLIERLGRYQRTLGPGFYLLAPFIERVAYIRDLREENIDVRPQECFTKDNVQVVVDGMLYVSVTDPVKACYGVCDYRVAATELALTTSRAEIGKLELDRTFEERDIISKRVVEEITEAGVHWGIRVHRYEIKNITTPESVRVAMEYQVTAERQRRAIIARSEGEMQACINRSEGAKEEYINRSEGEKQRWINEAEGRASEITALAEATARSLEKTADAIGATGGRDAIRLQLGERYLQKLAALARPNTQVVLPADLTHHDDLLRGLLFQPGAASGGTLEPSAKA